MAEETNRESERLDKELEALLGAEVFGEYEQYKRTIGVRKHLVTVHGVNRKKVLSA